MVAVATFQSLGLPRSVRRPVESGIEKQESRHISQEVCPWNSFAVTTSETSFLAREGLDGRALIEWMGMTQEEFSRRFKDSPIKRTQAPGPAAERGRRARQLGFAGGGAGAGADRDGGRDAGATGEGRGRGGRVGAGGDRGLARVPTHAIVPRLQVVGQSRRTSVCVCQSAPSINSASKVAKKLSSTALSHQVPVPAQAALHPVPSQPFLVRPVRERMKRQFQRHPGTL
jgi:hypothetical protein